ncbi:hypothetical protein ACFLSQ_11770, partial [Bacteroidota bacterium]
MKLKILISMIMLLCLKNISLAQDHNKLKNDLVLISSQQIIQDELPIKVNPGFLLIRDTYYNWETDHWSKGNSKLWHYDDNNKLIQIECLGSPYIISFFYDNEDNLICKQRSDYNKNQDIWVTTLVDSFFYDNNGNLIEEFELLLESGLLRKNDRDEYFYDSLGKLSEKKSYYGYYPEKQDTTGIWIFENSRLYDYDDDNNLISSTPTNHNQRYYKVDYTYNSDNLRLSEFGHQWYNDQWNQLYQYDFSYNEKGLMIEAYHNESESQIYRFLYEYDENDNKSKRTYQKFKDNSWDTSYVSIIYYTYDDNNNLIQEMKTIYEQGAFRNSYRIVYDYDK